MSIVIDTAITFLIQSLEQIQGDNQYIIDLVKKMRTSHFEYIKSRDLNKLNEVVSYLTNHQSCRDGISDICDKLCEIFQQIVVYMRKKSLILLEIIVVKLLEFYLLFLKYNVKDYLRFAELNELIKTINKEIVSGDRENYSKVIASKLFDDPIVNFIVGLLLTSECKASSFVKLADTLLMGDDSEKKSEVEERPLSASELLKSKRNKKLNKSPESSQPQQIYKSHEIHHCSEQEVLQHTSSFKPELAESVKLNETPHNTPVLSPPSTKRHGTSIVLTPEIGQTPSEEPIFQFSTIVKSSEESKEEKLQRILLKYGKSKKSSYDKSPPLSSPQEDVVSIILSRRRSPSMRV